MGEREGGRQKERGGEKEGRRQREGGKGQERQRERERKRDTHLTSSRISHTQPMTFPLNWQTPDKVLEHGE